MNAYNYSNVAGLNDGVHTGRVPKRPSQRPSDSNLLAAAIVRDTVKDALPSPEQENKDPAAVALGRKGGLKGGKARAERLSTTERSRIAKKAALARWRPMAEDSVRANLIARIAQLEADLAEARVALKVIDSVRSGESATRPAEEIVRSPSLGAHSPAKGNTTP